MSGLKRFISPVESEYYSERERWSETLRPMDVIESPFLFSSRQVVTEALSRYELYKKILGIPGAVVECGVHRGNNFLLFCQLSAILEPYSINRRIYGFDTFSGFGGRGISEGVAIDPRHCSDASSEQIEKAIALFDMNRAAGHMPKAEIVAGDAMETIPRFVLEHPEVTVAMLYLDFDLYEPTKCALEQFLPLMSKGGLVVMDEFNYERLPGPTRAVKEVCALGEKRLKKLPFDPFVAYFEL